MTTLALAAAVLLGQTAASPAPKTVAAPAWTTLEVKPELAKLCVEQAAAALRQDGYRVYTAAEMATLLGEGRQAELMGCTDEDNACMAELSAALGAQLTLVGSVAKLEDTFRAHLKLVRSGTSTVVAETQVEAKGEKALLDALGEGAHRLTGLAPPKATVRKLAWVPWGVGALSLAGGIGCFVVSHDFYARVQGRLVVTTDATDATVLHDVQSGKDLQTAGWVFSAVAAAAVVAGAAMFVFGGPAEPSKPSVALLPSGDGVALWGRF